MPSANTISSEGPTDGVEEEMFPGLREAGLKVKWMGDDSFSLIYALADQLSHIRPGQDDNYIEVGEQIEEALEEENDIRNDNSRFVPTAEDKIEMFVWIFELDVKVIGRETTYLFSSEKTEAVVQEDLQEFATIIHLGEDIYASTKAIVATSNRNVGAAAPVKVIASRFLGSLRDQLQVKTITIQPNIPEPINAKPTDANSSQVKHIKKEESNVQPSKPPRRSLRFDKPMHFAKNIPLPAKPNGKKPSSDAVDKPITSLKKKPVLGKRKFADTPSAPNENTRRRSERLSSNLQVVIKSGKGRIEKGGAGSRNGQSTTRAAKKRH